MIGFAMATVVGDLDAATVGKLRAIMGAEGAS